MEKYFGEDPEMIQVVQNATRNMAAAAAGTLRGYLESKINIPLNIAITGCSGTGKSSFVNAIRNINDGDENAAPTGVWETTTEVTEYPHPSYNKIIFSDLPGVGTPNFQAENYLKQVQFKRFDFFIILSASRFTENDVKLAKAIKDMGKKFYFVRSKVDIDLQNEQRRENFSKQKTLAKIKEHCIKELKELGIESPQVFLVSSHDDRLYDFPLLRVTLEGDLPKHKRDALLLASPSISPQIIQKKKEFFQRQIWGLTVLSGIVAAVPVPGLSVAVDLSLLAGAVTHYVIGFGLDIPSLKRISARTGIPYDELKAVLKSQLAAEEISKDLIMKIAVQFSSRVALMGAEEVSRFIPIVGIPVSMSLSAVTTYKLLKLFLELLTEDAQRISDIILHDNLQ